MRLPDWALSDNGGVLALVVETQAWLTLCLKELILSPWVKTLCFRVYIGISVRVSKPFLQVTTAQMFNLVSHRLESLQPVACCFTIRYGSGLS